MWQAFPNMSRGELSRPVCGAGLVPGWCPRPPACGERNQINATNSYVLFSKQQKIDQKTHCWGNKCGELSRTGWSAGSNLGSSQRVGGGGCAQLCPMCPALPCFSSSSVRSWHIRLAPIVTHGDQAVSWQKLKNACHTKLERWLS